MPVKKYMRRGTSVFKFVSTIASATMNPTRAELDGGTDLTEAIAAVDGWSQTNNSIETPDMADTFDSKIPGSDAADDSSMTFYEDEDTNTVETTLAKGTSGYIVILRKGNVAGSNSMDVFPVRVASQSPEYTADNEAAKFSVNFVITSRPLQGAAVPATNSSEVQSVAITGTPTGGTYTLTFNAQTTAGIAFNATAAAVQTALEALTNITPGDVVTAGGPHPDTAISVTFSGQYAGTNIDTMSASAAGLTGGTTPAVTVTTTTEGGTPL